MDEQLKNLKFDMDEEIQERQAKLAASSKSQIDVGQAIIIASVILVAGIWGGKIYYDYVQEQRAIAALKHFTQSLKSSMQESERRSAQYAKEYKIRQEQQAAQRTNQNYSQMPIQNQQITPPSPQATQQRPKQTEFNDRNYVPRGAANVVSSTQSYAQRAQQPEKKGGLKVVTIEEQKRLKDFCPFKDGSIEQRNCQMNVDLMSRNKN